MLINKDKAGNLVMKPSGNISCIIRNRYQPMQAEESEQRFIKARLGTVCLRANKPLVHFKAIKPEDCGALTSAPLITDGKDVWGYMDYQVKSFLTELAEGREIVWQKG